MNPKLQRFSQRPNNRNLSNEDLMRRFLIEERQREEMEMWGMQIAESQGSRSASSSSAGGAFQSSSSSEPSNFTSTGLLLNYDLTNPSSYPGSGNVIHNLVAETGSTYDLYLYNGPNFVSSNGGFMRFDGSNDFAAASQTININNSYGSQPPSIFNPATTDFTMGGWYRMRTFPAGTLPYFDIVGSGASDQVLFTNSNGAVGMFDRQLFTWNYYYQTSQNGVIQVNTWHHVIFTKKGDTKKFYVNGKEVFTFSAVTHPTGTYHITLGIYLDDNGFAPVDVGQSYLYNIALSSDEVLGNYNFAKSRYGL